MKPGVGTSIVRPAASRHARRSHRLLVALASAFVAWTAGGDAAATDERRELVICADPVNLPFSNDRREGFENRIADLVAAELDASLRYRWNVTWRGSFLRALRNGSCDLVMGVPAGLQGVAVTRPYYTSTYVFVTGRDLALGSFDDPRLRSLRIGLHAVGAERANTPPASALAVRGLTGQVVGYPMWGDDADGNPQGRILSALAAGEIDIAIVWGPIGGYFAKPWGERLVVTPVTTTAPDAAAPFVYAMSIGVRDGDDVLRSALDAALVRLKPEIRSILLEFGVPLVEGAPPGPRSASLQDLTSNRSNDIKEH